MSNRSSEPGNDIFLFHGIERLVTEEAPTMIAVVKQNFFVARALGHRAPLIRHPHALGGRHALIPSLLTDPHGRIDRGCLTIDVSAPYEDSGFACIPMLLTDRFPAAEWAWQQRVLDFRHRNHYTLGGRGVRDRGIELIRRPLFPDGAM